MWGQLRKWILLGDTENQFGRTSLLFNKRLKVHRLHNITTIAAMFHSCRNQHVHCFQYIPSHEGLSFILYMFPKYYAFFVFLIPCYIIFSLILSVYIYLKSCYIVIISIMTISYVPSFLSLLRFILLLFISCNESALLDVCVFLFTWQSVEKY